MRRRPWDTLLSAWLAVLVVLGVLGIASSAPGEEKAPPRVEPSAAAPPGEVLEWTSAQGKPYWYRLPRTLDRNKPPNLLLMLHGTGLKWGWAFWNYPIARGAFRPNDIVVAPEGMTPGQGDTFNFIQGKADGQQIADLIGVFKRRFPIENVYLYGHSQGAFFCYWFAGEHPELVDGIVAHAGNVLDVKHPKLAKEKVAIGILHGKADAVVSVDCAYRTEKIYREQGYKKLKLYVVEGLTEQSGHWPLPKEVQEMLEWLDTVSADTAGGALDVALHELAKEEPDLAAIVETAIRSDRLVKAHKGAERAALLEKQKALNAFMEDASRAHADALSPQADDKKDDKKRDAAPGAWAAHFRAANRALDPLKSWQSAVKKSRTRAAAHDKRLAAILALLETKDGGQDGGKAFAEGVKAAEQCVLGVRYDDFLSRLERLAASPARPVKPEDASRLRELIESGKGPSEEGARAERAITRKLAAAFREKHPDWFAAREGN